jgi:hypothetical protein
MRLSSTTAWARDEHFADQDQHKAKPESHSARMKRSIDSPAGRIRYGQHFATVEPVFVNLHYNKGERCNRAVHENRPKVA